MDCRWINSCPLRKFEEQGKLGLKWKKEYCEKNFRACKRYKMEGEGIPHPDNMLPDGTIKKGLP